MGQKSRRAANYIALGLGLVFVVSSQAHFTDRLTPALARDIVIKTSEKWVVLNRMNWPAPTFRKFLGYYDLLVAGLLYFRSTRQLGFLSTALGFGSGWYGQIDAGEELAPLATLLGVTVAWAILWA